MRYEWPLCRSCTSSVKLVLCLSTSGVYDRSFFYYIMWPLTLDATVPQISKAFSRILWFSLKYCDWKASWLSLSPLVVAGSEPMVQRSDWTYWWCIQTYYCGEWSTAGLGCEMFLPAYPHYTVDHADIWTWKCGISITLKRQGNLDFDVFSVTSH